MTRKSPALSTWQHTVLHLRGAYRDGKERHQRRLLLAQVVKVVAKKHAEKPWHVVLVELDANAPSPQAFFADHAHESVGFYRTLPLARVAADFALLRWASGKPCTCGPIKKPAPRRQVRVDRRKRP